MLDSLTTFILFLGIIAMFYLVVVYRSLYSIEAIVKKKLFNKDPIKISSFLNNETEKIKGNVIYFNTPLIAPLSGRKCAYYQILVEEYRVSGNSGSRKVKIIDEEKFDDIVIISDTKDFAIIDSKNINSHLYLDNKLEYVSNDHHAITIAMEKFLEVNNFKSKDFFNCNKELYYTEWVIDEDETLVVYGKANWQKTYSTITNIPKEKVLVFDTDVKETIYVSNDSLFFDKIK